LKRAQMVMFFGFAASLTVERGCCWPAATQPLAASI
jgi:hypothetical protein